MHLHNYSETIHWVLLQTFHKSNWIWKVIWRLHFQNYPTHHCTKMSRRESLCFLKKTFKVIWILQSGNWSVPFHYEYCWSNEHSHWRETQSLQKLYHSLSVSMNANVESYLLDEGSGLAFFSTDLGHIFGSFVDKEIGLLLRGKGRHKPDFGYDIVHIHSLMIYTDLIEYNIVSDTKAPLLRCFTFISKLNSGDVITTGQYMNCQTFSDLQFRPFLKNSFRSIHIDLWDTSGEKLPFVSFGITRFLLMIRKASNIHF